jgi:phosphoribosylamine-glycine ligase
MSAKASQNSNDDMELSSHDAAALVVNTAVELREIGHDIVVKNAVAASGKGVIVIVIPGYSFDRGKLVSTDLSFNGHARSD